MPLRRLRSFFPAVILLLLLVALPVACSGDDEASTTPAADGAAAQAERDGATDADTGAASPTSFTPAVNNPVSATLDGGNLLLHTACADAAGDLEIVTEEDREPIKVVLSGEARDDAAVDLVWNGESADTIALDEQDGLAVVSGSFERGELRVVYGELPACPPV